jgi:hypothetical protein
MKLKIITIVTLLQLFFIANMDAKGEPFLFGQENSLHIVVNNRILAKVNGKAISVMDVMKKMDMLFYRQFPEYTSSVQARYQFYQVNWKRMFQDLIDKELVIADAEEHKLPVSGGDVRQEMESMFGPNIITNLDKVDLTYDEASKMVLDDITIRRMMFIRVNTKAINKITPQIVRQAYEDYAKENVRPAEWTYYVISIRDSDPTQSAEVANKVHELLQEKISPTEISEKMKPITLLKKTTVNVSEELHHNEKDLNEAYKEILVKLTSGSFSQPIAQKSRNDKGSTVFRLFYLKEYKVGGAVPFNEVASELKDKLIDLEIDKESELYLKKLRQHFDVQDSYIQEMIANDFQPFSLK